MNILTFDIEDWWVYQQYKMGCPKDWLPRLDWYLNEILCLLDKKEIKATFFCLGDVAYNYPEIIKKIAQRGHQIGCHSYAHSFIGSMTPEEFFLDTKRALDMIENVVGEKIKAYRAPAFSITEDTKWALEILAENGIEYDCSIFPAFHRFGGYVSYPKNEPAILKYKDVQFKEFPIPLVKVYGKRIAYAGGGYFRLLPYSKIKEIISQEEYVMTYFHLRDFDFNQVKQWHFEKDWFGIQYFKDFYGIKEAFSKFERLIDDFDFVNLEQASDLINWNEVPVVQL